jgi:hypothetical protein
VPDQANQDPSLRALVAWHPEDVISTGVHLAGNLEGYYGVEGPPVGAGGDPAFSVLFYAVDDLASLRGGAWTYGERVLNRPRIAREGLTTAQSDLLSAYLASIR